MRFSNGNRCTVNMPFVIILYFGLLYFCHIRVLGCHIQGFPLEMSDAMFPMIAEESCRTWTRIHYIFNTLTPELNPSAQHCLTRFFTGDFAS
jgi:hypothetical protein